MTTTYIDLDKVYADILGALKAENFPKAYLEQTGGGCLAVQIPLKDGWYALIGDGNDGPLPWDREEPIKWEMGIHSNDYNHTSACEGYLLNNLSRGDITDATEFVAAHAPLLRMLGADTV